MNQDVLKQKEGVVSEVKNLIANSSATVVCEYRGLTVKEISDLRKAIKSKGGVATVYKNTLVAKATEDNQADLKQYLEGPNLFVFFKSIEDGGLGALYKFVKNFEQLNIKAGVIDGEVKDAEYVKTLASLPSKNGMVSVFLSVLQAPLRNLAYSLSKVAEKK
jgi:large subunit ribosomal protein L10